MTPENFNLLNESEWRVIYNALSVYESKFRLGSLKSQEIQQLMDKVRDNYIPPFLKALKAEDYGL